MRSPQTSRSSFSSHFTLPPTSPTPPLKRIRKLNDLSSTRAASSLAFCSAPGSPLHSPQPSRVLLSRLRTNSRLEAPAITPEVAAEVVERYLLPMFEAEARARKDQVRGWPAPGGKTVYSELKLSARLLEELQRCKSELDLARKHEISAKAAQVSAETELKQAQTTALQAESKVRVLLTQQSQALRTAQQASLSSSQLSGQLQALQTLHSLEEEKAKHYAALLQEERARNDKLRNQTTELEYSNSLLRMQSDVMGERLKGLYQAIESLAGAFAAQSVAVLHASNITRSFGTIMSEYRKMLDDLGKTTSERDELRGENVELAAYRLEVFGNKQRLARMMRDRLTFMQQSLKVAEEDRERLHVQVAQQDKRFFDLSEEFSKLRQRVRQFKQKRKAHGEEEERICKNCQRVYEDSENYNWSCRTHQSDFSGEIWWCCGKAGREAVGCRVTRHESREDEDGDSTDKKEQEAVRLAFKRCPSCTGYGHRPQECPKDPNIRSQIDLAEEMTRLDKIAGTRLKHKHVLPSPEMSAFALQVLTTRSQQFNFNDPQVASSPDSSLFEEAEEGAELQPFRDIGELKARARRAESSMEVAQYVTRELTKEVHFSKLAQIRRQPALRSAPVSPRARELFGSVQ